ncbi:hypothetical protein AD45P2_00560 [Alteromonas phage vB_AmaP_AD45-P2]|uniref:3'-5' exonuclease domain-containing protein n=1 Tax=Pseudorhizobium pelagicum TaxID=1509405 RepID=A0A922TAH1_9HYPH|nr:hypothetical protein [Pseudorhizobium pelagicum]YP_008126081.1 hypothetical protein M610_gp071 [Alteromonas phage vB_AmaP_AD45-P1]AGM47161.1 hypothetical protein AD45P4_00530 [Alteromonas phage vB_AmaP_AD45-P4]AGM47283.1 hypothetical protein AD45P2_00560 [Alteromonas phage vB_AmaP_AD45-P2]AGM46928.1 hypothetical protein AD45P1_00550 [Alteromonas phage vB_AmaP_AD45-P1]KEQ05599.1 hypothetical protein GV68_08705 [Pseudorhizobium pelagicum]
MKVTRSIEVSYKHTNDAGVAQKWLNDTPNLIAADLETAIRYSEEEVTQAKLDAANEELSKADRIAATAIANATPLNHPYHCTITHCSIATSEKDGLVFIIDNQDIADVVFDYLTTTEATQVWHNYSYDGRFIKYYGGGYPKNLQDSQILAKTLLNNVEVFKARTGLKDLAGGWYGDWGIDSDNFTLAQQYDEKVLKYAATDACATYKLWEYLNVFIADEFAKE